MLRLLSIRNFVVVASLDVEFERGLTVLTGETGAGKSILLDALSLLLGDRFELRQPNSRRRRAALPFRSRQSGTEDLSSERISGDIRWMKLPFGGIWRQRAREQFARRPLRPISKDNAIDRRLGRVRLADDRQTIIATNET